MKRRRRLSNSLVKTSHEITKEGGSMSVLIDRSTRLLVQGLTGREGTFHAKPSPVEPFFSFVRENGSIISTKKHEDRGIECLARTNGTCAGRPGPRGRGYSEIGTSLRHKSSISQKK